MLCLFLGFDATAQTLLRIQPQGDARRGADGRLAVDLLVESNDVLGKGGSTGLTNLTFRAYRHSPAGVVISEVSSGGTDIEFTQVGNTPVDLSGWFLVANEWTPSAFGLVQSNSVRRLESPAILQPGETILWTTRTNAPNVFPHLQRLGGGPQRLIEIRDASGALVDQVQFDAVESGRELRWTGPPLALGSQEGRSWSRIGTWNHFSSVDWLAGPGSIGVSNPGLSTPWVGPSSPVDISPATAALTNSVWTGTVRFAADEGVAWHLAASLQPGVYFESIPQFAPLSPSLSLRLRSGSLRGSEAEAGPLAEVEAALPSPNLSSVPVLVQLDWDAPGEFSSPKTVSIAPGATSTSFTVSNLDDAIADGTAVVHLLASSSGYHTASLEFLNEDDEQSVLYLAARGKGLEGSGIVPDAGSVMLPRPGDHATRVDLEYVGRVAGPPSLVIPAHSASASFPIVYLNDSIYDGPTPNDQIIGRIAHWTNAVSKVAIQDDENGGMVLHVPLRLEEGVATNGSIEFKAPRGESTIVTLTSDSGLLGIPRQLLIPAGTTFYPFSILVPDDTIAHYLSQDRVIAREGINASDSVRVEYADNDDPNLTLSIALTGACWANGPVPVTIQIRNSSSVNAPLSGPVQLRLLGVVGDLKLEAGQSVVQLSHGRFDGVLQFSGTASQVSIEATFGSLTARTPTVALLNGRTLTNGIQDAIRWPGNTNLLVRKVFIVGGLAQTSLGEFNPTDGSLVPRMTFANGIGGPAVTDSGRYAWIALSSGEIQRIDLQSWKSDRTFRIPNGAYIGAGRVLCALPGSEEDLFVSVSLSKGGSQILGYRNGTLVGSGLNFPFQDGIPVLQSGTQPGDGFAMTYHRLMAIHLSDGGPIISGEWPSETSAPGLDLVQDSAGGRSILTTTGLRVDTRSLVSG